jgi:hypothetical protein
MRIFFEDMINTSYREAILPDEEFSVKVVGVILFRT